MLALLLVATVVFGAAWWGTDTSTGTKLPPPRTARVDVLDGPERDQRVQLDVTLRSPATTPAPAVLLAHGFGEDKHSVAGRARELAARGFTVLTYSARGFGDSTGRIALNDPDYEVADAQQLLDWLARQPEVLRDGDRDPRVGVTGEAYGGALALQLAGTDPRVDAIAPTTTYNDLERALLPNNASGPPIDPRSPANSADSANPGVFKRAWAGLLFAAGKQPTTRPTQHTTEPPDQMSALVCGRFTAEVCRAYSETARTGRATARAIALFDRVSPRRVAEQIDVPTLLVQSTNDTLFGLDQAEANARQITRGGGRVKTMWRAGGHQHATTDTSMRNEIGDWFAHHLGGVGPAPDPGTGFEYEVAGPTPPDDTSPVRTVHAPDYPGVGGQRTARYPVPLRGDAAEVVHPSGDNPASTSSIPGTDARPDTARSPTSPPARDLPEQTATFRSPPVQEKLLVSGVPQTQLAVSTVPGQSGGNEAVLFAKLYDIGPDGRRDLLGDSVAPMRVTNLPADGSPVDVHVALPGIVHSIEPGHRVELAVTTTDQAYAGPASAAVHRVGLAGTGNLSVPSVHGVTNSNTSIPLVPLLGIGGIGVFTLLAWLFPRIRGESGNTAADLADTPLALSGVSKTHPTSTQGVYDLSFQVQRRQVLGLLGPNGTGKTTTLRMAVGLIHPEEGTIHLFGHEVRPGSPVLSRVGALIDQPGFLPHLSGLDNLRSYWAVTGRPILQAGFDEVLRIAGLGAEVHRQVRTYSQGTRQRLAIAQAMLGLPDLLILDEPANGLDPAQVHQLREILRRYADTGRAVLVSSHLLAEVERTCSHVAVLHGGGIVAAGTVSDVVGTDGAVSFGVDDPPLAARTLRSLDGTGLVELEDGEVHVDLGQHSTAVAVNALVTAGVSVHRVAPRRRLEDTFLQLVGDDQ